MFKWLRDKINTGSEAEYKNGLIRNGNFFHFMRHELPITRPDLIEVSHARLLGEIDMVRLMHENNDLNWDVHNTRVMLSALCEFVDNA